MASISSLGIGSGLDLNSLLDQLESAEREQLTPIVQQQNSYEAKISAFGTLENALSEFHDAAAKLADADTFKAVKTDLSGEALSVSADEEAVVGSYDIEVTEKARSYSVATGGVADKDENLGGGSVSFTLGNGESFSVDIGEDDSSLADIRNAINDADAGVTASIIDDGSDQPYRLVLSSTDTGTESAIQSVDFGALDGTVSLDTNTEIKARDARLIVNNVTIESQSNRVEGAIQGITLNVSEIGDATLDITRDSGVLEKNVERFVSAYNDLQGTLSNLTGYDSEAGSAGTLLGNATARGVETQLRNLMGDAVDGGAFSTLTDLGISLQLDGTLELDEGTLAEVVEDQPGDLADFFAGVSEGAGGFAGRLDTALGSVLDEGGSLESATGGLETRIEGLEQTYERTEARIGDTIERYRAQFAELDSMVAQMNSTSSYLTQQFDALSAQLGQ